MIKNLFLRVTLLFHHFKYPLTQFPSYDFPSIDKNFPFPLRSPLEKNPQKTPR